MVGWIARWTLATHSPERRFTGVIAVGGSTDNGRIQADFPFLIRPNFRVGDSLEISIAGMPRQASEAGEPQTASYGIMRANNAPAIASLRPTDPKPTHSATRPSPSRKSPTRRDGRPRCWFGTGAITADIARAVGPDGRALGIDRDEANVAGAARQYGGMENLGFQTADILALDESFITGSTS